ncbi:MAG: cob(I)yrinic acid a,c-diamide adenosyltransferase [Nitrospirota bacterium]
MAIRITRVYTRTGDRGMTGLVGGKRIAKDSPRVQAYGAVDELNSWVGLARAHLRTAPLAPPHQRLVEEQLQEIQQQLFDLGAQLATPSGAMADHSPQAGEREAAGLERCMDRLLKELKPLDSFILPGGGALTATLHLCRAVCRRAERDTVRLARAARIGRGPVIYLNRLSDLFFVLARWVGLQSGETEVLWRGASWKESARK